MEVKIFCESCDFDGVAKEMLPIGPLTISDNKTQYQNFWCPGCGIVVGVSINTTIEASNS